MANQAFPEFPDTQVFSDLLRECERSDALAQRLHDLSSQMRRLPQSVITLGRA